MLRLQRNGTRHADQTADQADQIIEIPTRRNRGRVADPPAGTQPGGEMARTIRRICTLCGWTQATDALGRTLAIASALEREGKSSLAQAIAVATAQDYPGGVLLLECDLLRPCLAGDFGTSGPGLSEILAGDGELVDDLAQVLRPTQLPNLWLLPAGNSRENPTRLLRSPRMEETLTELQSRFAFIILDLPAVLRSSDAAVLARLTDGVVFVVRVGATDQRAVQQALQLLSGARMHGAVLNRWHTAVPDLVRRLVAR